jgi:hypothetical protein
MFLLQLGVVEGSQAVALLHHGADIRNVDQRAGIGRHRVEDMAAAADQDAGPFTEVGRMPKMLQPIAAATIAAMAMTAVQPIGEVKGTSWSSCSGEDNRSSATFRKIRSLEAAISPSEPPWGLRLGPADRSSALRNCVQVVRGSEIGAESEPNKPQTSDLARVTPSLRVRQCETYHIFLPEAGIRAV